MAMIVNANPFRSGKPVAPESFNPYAARAAPGRKGRGARMSAVDLGHMLVATAGRKPR